MVDAPSRSPTPLHVPMASGSAVIAQALATVADAVNEAFLVSACAAPATASMIPAVTGAIRYFFMRLSPLGCCWVHVSGLHDRSAAYAGKPWTVLGLLAGPLSSSFAVGPSTIKW